jgi:hypothetical protein
VPHKQDQLKIAAPLGELARRALTEAIEVGLASNYTKGLDSYTKLMGVLRELDEEIALVVRQDRLGGTRAQPSAARPNAALRTLVDLDRIRSGGL